jgi:hypothetical protein
MKQAIGLAVLLAAGNLAFGQKQAKPEGREAVDKLCGCFEVDFKYAETFAPDANYKYHDREETGGVAELALPIEVSDKKVVIQHLLVVSPKMIVKHWREEWTYENPVIWKYEGDKIWVKTTLPADQVKGKWTQTVWEVSDEPRYQGFSQFVNLDGKTVWQNTTDAPLPRREYTTRNDYNILKRTNRISFNDSGYLHEQDNRKIVRTGKTDKLLVEEKGQNSYKKLEDKECAVALEYWTKNKEYWSVVRKVWDDYISKVTRIELKTKVDGKMLNEYLMALARDYTDKKISDADLYTKVKEQISKFIGREEKSVAAAN